MSSASSIQNLITRCGAAGYADCTRKVAHRDDGSTVRILISSLISVARPARSAALRMSGLVLARPAHDLAGPRDDLAAVEDEDRDRSLTADLLDLGAIASSVRQRPELQCAALDLLHLVGVPSLVERLCGLGARVPERSEGLAVGTGVENHDADVSSRRANARVGRPARSACSRSACEDWRASI